MLKNYFIFIFVYAEVLIIVSRVFCAGWRDCANSDFPSEFYIA